MQLDLPLDGGPQLRNVERENPLLAGFGLVVLEIQEGENKSSWSNPRPSISSLRIPSIPNGPVDPPPQPKMSLRNQAPH